MLEADDTVLVIVDVQGKLAHLVCDSEALIENLRKLIKGAQVFGLPIIQVEHNPKGLGPTIPEVSELLHDSEPIGKLSFGSCGNEEFMAALKATGRKQVLLAGIEAHVCVYQTAMGLAGAGYELHVVTDAVSSRNPENKRIALERIKGAGGLPTSVEMALFELLKVAKGETFKAILKIIK